MKGGKDNENTGLTKGYRGGNREGKKGTQARDYNGTDSTPDSLQIACTTRL